MDITNEKHKYNMDVTDNEANNQTFIQKQINYYGAYFDAKGEKNDIKEISSANGATKAKEYNLSDSLEFS